MELRELIVLDDVGQYGPNVLANITGVRLVSSPVRFRTLGEKRNASAALVSPDVEAYCVWDDDDAYLPWHMSAAAKALREADYSIPTAIYVDKKDRLAPKDNQCLFHGAWAFRRRAFDKVHGYPFIQSGQDQGLLQRFKAAKLRPADPLQFDPRPSYIYRWCTTECKWHLSAMGKNGYEKLAERSAEAIRELKPHWERNWLELYEKARSSDKSSSSG